MKRITLFKKGLPIILASLSVVISLGSTFHEVSINASAETQEATTQTVLAEETDTAYVEQEEYQTVVSYMDVFEAYYQQASERLSDGNIEMPYTFEEFCDGYYTFNMEIQAYTDLIVDEAYGRVSMVEYEVSLAASALPSADEDYIIKGDTADPNIPASFDPGTTPYAAIQRDIYYTLFDFSAIREGDIILETATTFNDIGHTAFVYDVDKPAGLRSSDQRGRVYGKSNNEQTYIQTIEAVGGGVQFGFLDDTRMVDFGVIILRATKNSSIIESAKYFVKNQLGKLYDFPLTEGRANTSINSVKWYCSELIYAAYKYAGYDLYAVSSDGWVWPYALANTGRTNYVCVSNCFDAKLIGKESGKWKIRVYNNSSSSATLYYNTKLAFFDDAKNWTNSLSNTTSVSISANSYTTVYITTNVFATTAAFSRVINGRRYVTYCDGINNSTLRMRVRKNVI